MALWHLLILIGVAMPIGSALSSARYANVGPSGYALAGGVGLIVGGLCAYVQWITHKSVGDKLEQSSASPATRERYFRAFYLAKMAWVGVAAVLASWLSLAALHAVL